MKIARFAYRLYHILLPSQNANCRYIPTCSEYSLRVIEKHGLIVGLIKAILRVSTCHQWSRRPIYDPA